MYRFCRGDKQGYNLGRPCRPRPSEPAFQRHAYCVICAHVLPRPPYDFAICAGSSEEDAEYVDSVEIERAVKRLPFQKSSDASEKRSIWGVIGGSKSKSGGKAALPGGHGVQGTKGGERGAGGGKEAQGEDKREWAERVNAAIAARRQPELRRKLSGSFTLYGLSRSNSRGDSGNSRGNGPGSDEPEVWVVSRPKPITPRGPARCREHTHTPSSLATSTLPPEPEPQLVTVPLGLGLGRLGPFTIGKTGVKEKKERGEGGGKLARTKSRWRQGSTASTASTASNASVESTASTASRESRASTASIESKASTTSTASIATTISMAPAITTTTTTATTITANGGKKAKGKKNSGAVSSWPNWTVLGALRVFRPQHAQQKARERIHL